MNEKFWPEYDRRQSGDRRCSKGDRRHYDSFIGVSGVRGITMSKGKKQEDSRPMTHGEHRDICKQSTLFTIMWSAAGSIIGMLLLVIGYFVTTDGLAKSSQVNKIQENIATINLEILHIKQSKQEEAERFAIIITRLDTLNGRLNEVRKGTK